MTYERVQHLVDIDENIFAAFVVDYNGSISELFIAPDSRLDKQIIEKFRTALNLKSNTIYERETMENLLGVTNGMF